MILGSHNSWSYLRPRKWWMRLISFTAQCQEDDIFIQYSLHNTRCFDLRVRFKGDELVVAHGIIEYDIDKETLLDCLSWLNLKGDTYVRLIHEVRREKDYTQDNIDRFRKFAKEIDDRYDNIKFWCGKNLYNWECDYFFPNYPSCEEKYASVCNPKLIDDWYPRWFASRNNDKIKKEGTDKDILLIDFVNI